jgi:hypothetical protein
MKLIVTVKAYPTVTQSEGETVCVAGVRTDTQAPEWVRLWPVGFRELPDAERFAKWQEVEIDAAPSAADARPESHRPNLQTLRLGAKVDTRRDWALRRGVLGPLLGRHTLCELMGLQGTAAAPSMGLVRVRPGAVATIHSAPDWEPAKHLQAEIAAAPHLLRDQALAVLRPPQFQIRYRWQCLYADCQGHTHNSCDWEVGAATIKFNQKYPANQVQAHLLAKFGDQIVGEDKETYFFMGNQHRYPETFMVLGAFYPKEKAN